MSKEPTSSWTKIFGYIFCSGKFLTETIITSTNLFISRSSLSEYQSRLRDTNVSNTTQLVLMEQITTGICEVMSNVSKFP